PDPGPLREPRGRGRPEHPEVAARELEERLAGGDRGRRDDPDDRSASALPADGDAAGEGGVAEAVADPEQLEDVAVAHPAAAERRLELRGRVLRPLARPAG